MTEAAHQMASNPLPPGERRPRTVGLATGVELAILDDAWRPLAAGESGEVVGARAVGRRRLPRRTRRPTPSRSATGGSAPATCGALFRRRLPHARRPAQGAHQSRRREDLPARGRGGAAVAPRGGRGGRVRGARRRSTARRSARQSSSAATDADARELMAHCADRLAAFKVPASHRVVDEIPKGPTGKVQRRAWRSCWRHEGRRRSAPAPSAPTSAPRSRAAAPTST